MTVAVTGHRPNKLNNEYNGGPLSDSILETMLVLIKEHGITHGISGMAIGVDQLWAMACTEAGIPFTAAVPCKGQEKVWPVKGQQIYQTLLARAEKVVYISEKYSPECMQKRNVWMVDNSEAIISVWDGSSGGTKNCIRYAESKGIRIIPIDIFSLKNGLR